MKQVIFRNKKIFYNAGGKGKPVMLLHGFAEDHNIWNYQLEKLREKFYVIAPDLPGSGKSEMPARGLSIEEHAEVVKAVADAALNERKEDENGAKVFTLIGHSMGGYVTLAFAERYPGLLNGFGLFHSTAYADDDAKKQTRRKGIEFIRSNGTPLFLKTSTPNLFSEKTKKEDPALVEKLIDAYAGFSPESLVQYYEAMIQRPDRTSVLQAFEKPVLFITGKNDTAVPLQTSLQQCYLPSVSEIHILQNSGHMGMWEEREHSTAFLRDFLIRL